MMIDCRSIAKEKEKWEMPNKTEAMTNWIPEANNQTGPARTNKTVSIHTLSQPAVPTRISLSKEVCFMNGHEKQ